MFGFCWQIPHQTDSLVIAEGSMRAHHTDTLIKATLSSHWLLRIKQVPTKNYNNCVGTKDFFFKLYNFFFNVDMVCWFEIIIKNKEIIKNFTILKYKDHNIRTVLFPYHFLIFIYKMSDFMHHLMRKYRLPNIILKDIINSKFKN